MATDGGNTGDPPTPGSVVVLFGGMSSLPSGFPYVPSLQDTWTFDGVTWSPASSDSTPSNRYESQAATLGKQVLLFGGLQSEMTDEGTNFDDYTEEFQDTWLFSGGAWTNPSEMTFPSGREDAAITAFGGTSVLLFGGYDISSQSALSDTWIYNGSVWAESTATGPGASNGFVAAAIGTKALLFGGTNSSSGNPEEDNETWTFDGAAWTQLNPSSSPPVGSYSMSPLGSRVVLFGSPDDGTRTVTTWVFDGTDWSEVTTAHAPTWRLGFMMATLGDAVIVFGGQSSTGLVNDTWSFDGTDWKQLSPAGALPPARSDGVLVTLPL
jgi:hypothetical protein